MRYFLGGINGVGKTTFLTEIQSLKLGFSVIRTSLKLFEWLDIPLGDYSKLRALPATYKNIQLENMMYSILKDDFYNNKDTIIEAHYLNLNMGAIYETIGQWVSEIDAFILINSEIKIVWNRIKNDSSNRNRDLFPINSTKSEQIALLEKYATLTKLKAKEISCQYKIPLLIIENEDNHLSRAVNSFLEFHNTLKEKREKRI